MGFTTMTANAAGAVMTLYLSASGIDKRRFVGTSAWFFLIVNLAKVPFSIGLGLMHPVDAVRALVLAPVVLLGGLLGYATVQRISQRPSTSPCCGLRPRRGRPPAHLSGPRSGASGEAGWMFHGVTTCGAERPIAGAPGTSRCARSSWVSAARRSARRSWCSTALSAPGAQQREVVGVEVVGDERPAADTGGRERRGDAGVAAAHRVDGATTSGCRRERRRDRPRHRWRRRHRGRRRPITTAAVRRRPPRAAPGTAS